MIKMGSNMLGIDIIEISRVIKLYEKHKEKFLNRIFNDDEIAYIKSRPNLYESLSAYFAAKEAISKANGTGIDGISFKDIKLEFEPYIAKIGEKRFTYSVSHERKFAVAVAKEVKCGIKIEVPHEFKGALKRKVDSHKGDYGRVGFICGSNNMPGALMLSLMASLRTGSGLVYFNTDREIKNLVLSRCFEAIYRENLEFLKEMDAICIGPGLGNKEELFLEVIREEAPMVVDADGLNILSRNLEKVHLENKVLTPHLGEFSRLTKLSIEEIEKDKLQIAKDFAKKYRTTLLLKGNKTIVTDVNRVYINNTGGPELATAGSGDVLSGIITSLIGRKIEPFKAASMGAYIHGLSGSIAKEKLGENSVIARDIVENIPFAIKNL